MTLSTPDFPDWSTPSRSVAVDVDLTPAAGVIGTGSPYLNIDVSQMESVLIQLRPPAGAGGDRFLLRASWGGPFTTGRDEYLFFHDSSAYSPLQQIIGWDLPCKGSTLSLRVTSTNNNTTACQVIGTSRKYPRNTVTLQGQVSGSLFTGVGRYIANLPSVVLAAGATSSPIFVPPVTEKILMHCNFRTSVFSVTVNALDVAVGAVTADRLCSIPGDSANNGQVPIFIPETGLEVVVTNGDTVGHSTNLKIWDVS